MDPPEDELRQINNLDEAFDWAGVEDALRDELRLALGRPQRVREVALIPRPVWDQAILQLQMPDATMIAQPPLAPGMRALTPVELARLESVRRICNLRTGQPPDDRLGAMPPAPAVPGPPFPLEAGWVLQGA